MNPQDEYWTKLKANNHFRWKSELDRRTLETLTVLDTQLSRHNQSGYFHRVRDRECFQQMRDDWNRLHRIPEEWISKGIFPGIWTALFSPHNTYSIQAGPLYIVRFYFRGGFNVYDDMNGQHKKLWKEWAGKKQQNPWDNLENERGRTLKQRIRTFFSFSFPSHKRFFENYKFGAVIGYSDYISLVIMLEDSVENVEFLEL